LIVARSNGRIERKLITYVDKNVTNHYHNPNEVLQKEGKVHYKLLQVYLSTDSFFSQCLCSLNTKKRYLRM